MYDIVSNLLRPYTLLLVIATVAMVSYPFEARTSARVRVQSSRGKPFRATR